MARPRVSACIFSVPFVTSARERLRHDFGIGHVTLQIETSNETHCALAPEDVV